MPTTCYYVCAFLTCEVDIILNTLPLAFPEQWPRGHKDPQDFPLSRTSTPERASANAIPRPIPLAAPETTAALS